MLARHGMAGQGSRQTCRVSRLQCGAAFRCHVGAAPIELSILTNLPCGENKAEFSSTLGQVRNRRLLPCRPADRKFDRRPAPPLQKNGLHRRRTLFACANSFNLERSGFYCSAATRFPGPASFRRSPFGLGKSLSRGNYCIHEIALDQSGIIRRSMNRLLPRIFLTCFLAPP